MSTEPGFYAVYVDETVVQRVRYVVKADSQEEAGKKAQAQNPDSSGDDDTIKFSGVTHTFKQIAAEVQHIEAIDEFSFQDHKTW